jgi:hypothetical protein
MVHGEMKSIGTRGSSCRLRQGEWDTSSYSTRLTLLLLLLAGSPLLLPRMVAVVMVAKETGAQQQSSCSGNHLPLL